jgi:hypothetical protein
LLFQSLYRCFTSFDRPPVRALRIKRRRESPLGDIPGILFSCFDGCNNRLLLAIDLLLRKSRQGQNFSQEFQPRGQIFLKHGHAHSGEILTATRGKPGADKIQGVADLQRGPALRPVGQESGS